MFNRDKVDPKLKELPEKPGVYIMKDAAGNIIYVGKAINLKRRVTQYFRQSVKAVKVQAMVDKIDDFEYVRTLTETDALTLEATLIKKHMPRYNILLKDDKGTGAYIRIDLRQKFPCVEMNRHPKRDGAKYYGPFANGSIVRSIIGAIKSAYGVRTCSRAMTAKRECLDYHIGLCLAPCTGRVTEEEYRGAVNKAVAFMSGKSDEVYEIVEAKMKSAAEADDFERAIEYRTTLKQLSGLKSRNVGKIDIKGNADVFAYITDGLRSAVSLMPVRGNKLLAPYNFPSEDASESGEALTSFIMQYYAANPVPEEVFVNVDVDEPLEKCLADIKGGSVKVNRPQRGIKHDLILTAEENAREYVEVSADKAAREHEKTVGACEMLCSLLGLKSARRMECYDISHISGTDKVASGVCFLNGAKAGAEYRRYKIKTVEGNDDFHCMAEVLSRRLKRAADGDEKFAELPDLIVIDGGKGQLHAAHDIMADAGFHIPMVGLAKREEEIFVTGRSESIILSRDSAALKLLQRIRDEAHRFAITYHRNTRMKRIKTKLTDIDGVGEKKAKILLKAFGSYKNISILPVEAIESVQGIDKPTANKIFNYFHPEKEETRKQDGSKI